MAYQTVKVTLSNDYLKLFNRLIVVFSPPTLVGVYYLTFFKDKLCKIPQKKRQKFWLETVEQFVEYEKELSILKRRQRRSNKQLTFYVKINRDLLKLTKFLTEYIVNENPELFNLFENTFKFRISIKEKRKFEFHYAEFYRFVLIALSRRFAGETGNW
jgi:hypothetical protein